MPEFIDKVLAEGAPFTWLTVVLWLAAIVIAVSVALLVRRFCVGTDGARGQRHKRGARQRTQANHLEELLVELLDA